MVSVGCHLETKTNVPRTNVPDVNLVLVQGDF